VKRGEVRSDARVQEVYTGHGTPPVSATQSVRRPAQSLLQDLAYRKKILWL